MRIEAISTRDLRRSFERASRSRIEDPWIRRRRGPVCRCAVAHRARATLAHERLSIQRLDPKGLRSVSRYGPLHPEKGCQAVYHV